MDRNRTSRNTSEHEPYVGNLIIYNIYNPFSSIICKFAKPRKPFWQCLELGTTIFQLYNKFDCSFFIFHLGQHHTNLPGNLVSLCWQMWTELSSQGSNDQSEIEQKKSFQIYQWKWVQMTLPKFLPMCTVQKVFFAGEIYVFL